MNNATETMTADEWRARQAQPKRGRQNKYNARRTEYNGREYRSRFEAAYAYGLDLLVRDPNAPEVFWSYEPSFDLGGITTYKADFLLICSGMDIRVIETKGAEDKRFPLIKKLWRQFGPYPLWIVKQGKQPQVIMGGMALHC